MNTNATTATASDYPFDLGAYFEAHAIAVREGWTPEFGYRYGERAVAAAR